MGWSAVSEMHSSCSPPEEMASAMWPGVWPGAATAWIPGTISTWCLPVLTTRQVYVLTHCTHCSGSRLCSRSVCSKVSFWRVGEKKGSRVRVRMGAIADGHAFESLYLEAIDFSVHSCPPLFFVKHLITAFKF